MVRRVRASRLISLTLELQTHGAMTAGALAERLGVSLRTVHRDVDALRAAGVPIEGERGPAGGFRLPGGYRTRLTGLSAAEAESLFLATPAGPLGLGPILADAQLKVLAALPPGLRARADRATALFHVDRRGWFTDEAPSPQLPAIASALWDGTRLRLRHRGRERVVDPLGLVLKGPTWYLVAQTTRGTRTFRVDRIEAAQTLADEPAQRPAEFDLEDYWTRWSAEFEQRLPLLWVRVGVDDDAYPSLRRGADVRARDQLPAAAPPGGEVDVPYETLAIAEAELRKLGAGVVALEPPELRDALAAGARATAERYGALGLAADEGEGG
jgi:predicted DNA-binding transcriptional regulator YafY